MKKLMLLVPMALVAIQVSADQSGGIAAIEKQYAKLKVAIVAKDMERVMRLCTSDFVWVLPSGQSMGRKEFQTMMSGQMAMKGLTFHKVSMKNDSFGFMGNECRVRCSSDLNMSAIMDGKRMSMTSLSESVDTWRRTPKGWKICKVEVLSDVQKYGK